MDNWKSLTSKIDVALKHSAVELERMAAIYKRRGKTRQASEIEIAKENLDKKSFTDNNSLDWLRDKNRGRGAA